MDRMLPSRRNRKIEEDGIPLTEINLTTTPESEEVEYPAAWKLAVITVALCMAIFLVALVSLLPILRRLPSNATDIALTGYHHSCRCDPTDHRPFQSTRRRYAVLLPSQTRQPLTNGSRVVWKRLPVNHLRLPTCIWQMLFHLFHQDRLPKRHRYL